MSRSSAKVSLPSTVRLRSAGGSTSSTTSVSRAIVTASPARGTLPSGQAAGSDQRTVLTGADGVTAAAAAWSWLSCAATPDGAPSIRAGSSKENRYRPGRMRITFIPSVGTRRVPHRLFEDDFVPNEPVCQAGIGLGQGASRGSAHFHQLTAAFGCCPEPDGAPGKALDDLRRGAGVLA